jgi:hypothetical protein
LTGRYRRLELEEALGRKAVFDSRLFADLKTRAKVDTFSVGEKQLLRHVLSMERHHHP